MVLISHNHYDHLDLATVERIWQRDKPRIIVPLGNDTIIKSHNSAIDVEAYDWGDSVNITDAVKNTLEPMHHWSARGLFDHNKALWAAFVIGTVSGNIYFVGDSGYGNGDYFMEARQKYSSMRLALLPIGSYNPRWFMSYGHMDPEEAVRAYHDLGEPLMIPSHYDVFRLTDVGYKQALEELKTAMEKYGVGDNKVHVISPGQNWTFPAVL